MLQPFESFKVGYIKRLLQLGRPYLVSQTYCRVKDKAGDPYSSRINLLFSDYLEFGEARLHLNAVKKDRYAAIINLSNPLHRKKILEMLQADSGYRIFFAVVRSASDLEEQINRQYREQLRKFVEKETNWRIATDAVVKTSVQLGFGEIFVILRHGSQRIRIKFADIE